MKLFNGVPAGIIKATLISIAILCMTVFLFHDDKTEAVVVMTQTDKPMVLTEDNLVTLFHKQLHTDHLHKVKLELGKVELQFHFENMLQLVEQLDQLLNEYTHFSFVNVKNVNDLVITVSEETPQHLIYKVKINKLDYLAGKEVQIEPLQ